jgi:hypothetical protein
MSISRAAAPLRLIFWGVLLLAIDLSVGGFDILNDFAGALMVLIGVAKLSAFEVDRRYRTGMLFVLACSALVSSAAFAGLFKINASTVPYVFEILGLASLVATVVFCTSMHHLAKVNSLHQSSASWLTTRLLVILFDVIPSGLFYVVGLCSVIGNISLIPNGYLGLTLLALLLLGLVSLIHFLVSTSRMVSETGQKITTVKGVLVVLGIAAIPPIIGVSYLAAAVLTPQTRMQAERLALENIESHTYGHILRGKLALVRAERRLASEPGANEPELDEAPFIEIMKELGDTMFEFEGKQVAWDIIAPEELKPDDKGKTIVLFPDLKISEVGKPLTPLVVHVFSTQNESEEVCLYIVFAEKPKPAIDFLTVKYVDLKKLLDSQTPADAADWYESFSGTAEMQNIFDLL